MNELIEFLKNKKILILGFGKEGKSTYKFIRKHFKNKVIYIADQNDIAIDDDNVILITGPKYLENLDDYDLVIKSPGISFKGMDVTKFKDKISSELELFLTFINAFTIGVTGTKGKSTTSSLIYNILLDQDKDVLLLGNIGVPLFDYIESVKNGSILVIEMSSHQLEFVNKSPNIALLLNIFQEHLDHYNSYNDYINAKLNIYKYQNKNDYLIYNIDNEELNKNVININSNVIKVSNNDLIPSISNVNFQADSFKYDTLFALAVSKVLNLDINKVIQTINSFEQLPHRMEYVGNYDEIDFYDDSIATIPEATINSIKALKRVDTLIFGGLDRGINLDLLINYLNSGFVRNLICMPDTGIMIGKKIENKNINVFNIDELKDAVILAKKITVKGKICLLAPAAASYGHFKNFEEKGNLYQKYVREL